MIKDNNGNKVSAKVKAKILLSEYLSDFKVIDHCEDIDDMKRTEPDKVQEQANKIIEKLQKKLVIKEKVEE